MGSPLDTDLAGVCKQIWGKALSNVKNKEELQKILIPSNCTVTKTPRLNTEIYIKLNEGEQNKERSAQAKQKESAKASVPILQAMVFFIFLQINIRYTSLRTDLSENFPRKSFFGFLQINIRYIRVSVRIS